jgi:hypothetical protein
MTDIVERLRRCADRERPYGPVSDICDEAAAEIERLRAALWDVHALANGWRNVPIIGAHFDRIRHTARAALAQGGE